MAASPHSASSVRLLQIASSLPVCALFKSFEVGARDTQTCVAVDNAVMCVNDKVLLPILDGMNKNPKEENFLREVCLPYCVQCRAWLAVLICGVVSCAGLFCNTEFGSANSQ